MIDWHVRRSQRRQAAETQCIDRGLNHAEVEACAVPVEVISRSSGEISTRKQPRLLVSSETDSMQQQAEQRVRLAWCAGVAGEQLLVQSDKGRIRLAGCEPGSDGIGRMTQ